MQPREISRLAPHYLEDRGLARDSPERRALQDETRHLDAIVASQSKRLGDDRVDLTDIWRRLGLEDGVNDEAFMELRLLPAHDIFQAPDGRNVPSRFLIVDSRSPYVPNDPEPTQRLRSYFLLIGEMPPLGHIFLEHMLFPYYVVRTQGEGTRSGEPPIPPEPLTHPTPHVSYICPILPHIP